MNWSINMTDFLESPFTYSLSPYLGILGEFFFAFLILIPAVYIFIQSDRNSWISVVYLLTASAIFGLILPLMITSLMLILSAFVMTGLLIAKLAEKRGR